MPKGVTVSWAIRKSERNRGPIGYFLGALSLGVALGMGPWSSTGRVHGGMQSESQQKFEGPADVVPQREAAQQ